MTRGLRSSERPEQISMRMPKELVTKIDKLKEKEGVDRSAIINKAVRYWTDVAGNVTTDHEYLIRLQTIEENTTQLRNDLDKVIQTSESDKRHLQDLINKQQDTIDTLLALLSKKD